MYAVGMGGVNSWTNNFAMKPPNNASISKTVFKAKRCDLLLRSLAHRAGACIHHRRGVTTPLGNAKTAAPCSLNKADVKKLVTTAGITVQKQSEVRRRTTDRNNHLQIAVQTGSYKVTLPSQSGEWLTSTRAQALCARRDRQINAIAQRRQVRKTPCRAQEWLELRRGKR